jgi:DNA (cytosine-5)-methyltransferase 1
MNVFYNEIEEYAAKWLRNLIEAGHIAPGVVDERSIVDLDPDELRRYTQCHFFAGIGVWSYALRIAGVPDDRPVWTGSCPCQPFSAVGKRGGHEDERHLWPAWRRLIRECAPAVVYGEQVASPDGLAWLDVVLSDMENDHYAVAAANLCAAGVGAPHARQRLFFVGNALVARLEGHARHGDFAQRRTQQDRPASSAGASGGWWAGADWVPCADPGRVRWRPVEPGSFPLVDGSAFRVGSGGTYEGKSRAAMLKGYGNAIVAEAAAAFITAAEQAALERSRSE